MNSINIPSPNIDLKFKKGTNELALCDFLSHRSKFAEEYIKKLMLSSKQFGNNLAVIETQDNGQPDIINLDTKKSFEVKTLWGEKGCEFLSNLKDLNNENLNEMLKLNIFETIEEHFKCINENKKHPKEIDSLIKKMKKKTKCDYVLFYPFSPSPNAKEWIPATDIDSTIWKTILDDNIFDFSVYTIKPNFDNEFVLTKITKKHISFPIFFKYNIFFKTYYNYNY